MKGGSSSRCRLDTTEPEIADIECIDEGDDHANGVLLVDPAVEALRQKRRLSPIRLLDKSLHYILENHKVNHS